MDNKRTIKGKAYTITTDESNKVTGYDMTVDHRSALLMQINSILPQVETLAKIDPVKNEYWVKTAGLFNEIDYLLLNHIEHLLITKKKGRGKNKGAYNFQIQLTQPAQEEQDAIQERIKASFHSKEFIHFLEMFQGWDNLLKPAQPTKATTDKYLVKQSGHYVDQRLINNRRIIKKPKASQPEFEFIKEEDRERAEAMQHERNMPAYTVKGIQLSPSEDKLMNILLRFLHDGYYAEGVDTELYGQTKDRGAVLIFTPYQLISQYTGTTDYSGKEIQNVNQVLNNLADRKFWISYQRKYKEKGENRTDRIDSYEPLITIKKYYKGLTDEENNNLKTGDLSADNQKSRIGITLHPCTMDQFDTKFILRPSDIDEQIELAAGGPKKVNEAMKLLSLELFRQLGALSTNKNTSNKDSDGYYWPIDKANLPYYLGEVLTKKADRSDWPYVRKHTEAAIDVCKKLGLLLNVKETTGAKGQIVCKFYINMDYYKEYKTNARQLAGAN